MRPFALLKSNLSLLLACACLALLMAATAGPAFAQRGRNELPGGENGENQAEPEATEDEQAEPEDAQPEQIPDEDKEPNQWNEDFGEWEEFSREHEAVLAAFNEVVTQASFSTVEVICDGEPRALGAIVSEDGEILTKASQLSGNIECLFRDGTRLSAERLATVEEYDLALLKVQATGLVPITWADSPSVPLGSWLVTPGAQDMPLAIGVLSVAPRRILPVSGILGIVIEEGDRGPVIVQIIPGSGAESAGLHADDVVLKVNGQEVETREELVDIIRDYRPGTPVELLILRDGREMEFSPVLGHRPSDPEHDLSAYQNSLGGELSVRRAGFPSVMQHDTPLAPAQCGGPILNLDGQAVGINIARAGRVNSYAIPLDVVFTMLAQLRGEQVAGTDAIDPDVQQIGLAEQIEALQAQLAERQAAIEQAAAAREGAQAQVEQAETQLQEAEAAAAELQARLEELQTQLAALDEAEEHGHEGEPHETDTPQNSTDREPSVRNRNRN